MASMDITERLTCVSEGRHLDLVDIVCDDAVSEIQKLRKALERIRDFPYSNAPEKFALINIARDALGR